MYLFYNYIAHSHPMSDPLQNRRLHARTKEAFSLIEVALAIAITGFAVVSLVALIPGGMTTFRQAMDTSISAQIVQRVFADAQETDFDSLLESGEVRGEFFVLPTRYFDDQGEEVLIENPAAPSASELARARYEVHLRGSLPGDSDPSKHKLAHFTSLPARDYPQGRYNPRNATILTAQIAHNPAQKRVPLDASQLIDKAAASRMNVPMMTYSIVLARNNSVPPTR